MIQIGANPIGWSNDDLRELGAGISLETCLAEARKAGFTGMELGHKFPRDASSLRPILNAHGIRLVSGWYSCRLLEQDARTELAAMRVHADLLKAMGCGFVIVAETSNAIHSKRQVPLSARPTLAKSEWRLLADRITELARFLSDDGLALAYHHHMGTVVQSEADIDRFMEKTGDEVLLLLDTGHAFWGGADPALLAQRYHSRIGHVHCKDVREEVMRRANAEDWSFLDAVIEGVFTVPGDGIIDYAPVLRQLPDYEGWLVVEAEQDPERAEPGAYAKLGFENLARFAKDAGFEIAK